MSSIDDGELYLEIADATEEQLQRGIVAARRSFAKSGVSIEDAFQGYFNRQGHDASDTLHNMSDADRNAATALDDAWLAAVEAARGDVPLGTIDGDLGLLKAVRESQQRQRATYEMLRPENRIEPLDTGPHYTLPRGVRQ